MAKKFGFDNRKSINEIQEAVVVDAPKIAKVEKCPVSRSVYSWVAFIFLSYLLTGLIMVTTGLFEKLLLPTWIVLTIPLVPTFIRLLIVIIKLGRSQKAPVAG